MKVRFVVKPNYVCYFSFTLFTRAGPSLIQVNSIINLQTGERSIVAELKQELYVNIVAPNLELFVMQNKTEQKARISRYYLAFSMAFTSKHGPVSDVTSIFQLIGSKQFG